MVNGVKYSKFELKKHLMQKLKKPTADFEPSHLQILKILLECYQVNLVNIGPMLRHHLVILLWMKHTLRNLRNEMWFDLVCKYLNEFEPVELAYYAVIIADERHDYKAAETYFQQALQSDYPSINVIHLYIH